ncbi:MAG: alanine/glycine:cation symporter family protein [Planctomycetota bacterium]|nr:alanine/glycine:cation symporter family protein [Planctomycetota bacterium]
MRLQSLLNVLLLAAIFTAPVLAQDTEPVPTSQEAPRQEAPAEQEGDWQQSVDEAFKKALDFMMFVPFYNIGPFIGISDDKTAIKDKDGNTLYATGPNGETLYITDEDGKQVLDLDGQPQLLPVYLLNKQGKAVQTKVPIVVLWLVLAAVFFTARMGFVNLRLFGHAIAVVRGKYTNPADAGEVTHFQALSSALSATVGLGNIAGVAIAVMVGGPGATFWMIVAGFLGMTLKFTECTLGQKFRKIDDQGRVSGGPMHYLSDGLAEKGLGGLGMVLAIVFTVFCIGGSLAGGNAFQVNQSLGILKEKVPFFAEHGYVYGLVKAAAVAVVIIGGFKRIAQTAEKIVPTMCGIYILGSLTILVLNIDMVGPAFGAIFGGAFTGNAIYGGAIGSLVMGFQRAAFSNEAGIGSAAIAHSAAKTAYPVREGVVALLEPFIDTIVICTMTALVIVITGVYTGDQTETAKLVAGKEGAALTSVAFQSVPALAGWFPWVLMVAVMLFAFSTMISWSYYGERCWTNLFGQGSSIIFKVLFLVFVVLGSVITAQNVLEFGDLMILLMAFPNILGLYFLQGHVKQGLDEYEQKRNAGEFETYK